MGEAVGVADHELLERVLRIEAAGDRFVVDGRRAGATAGFGGWLRPSAERALLARPHADDRRGAEDRDGARLQHARKAVGNPGPQLARRLDGDLVAVDLDEAQRREPD